MDIKEIIKQGVTDHIEEFKISTYALRKSKLFELSHDTIRKITQVEDYIPNAWTCKKALKGLGYTFEYSVINGFTNLKKKEDEQAKVSKQEQV